MKREVTKKKPINTCNLRSENLQKVAIEVEANRAQNYSISVHELKNGKTAISNLNNKGISLFLSLLLNLPFSALLLVYFVSNSFVVSKSSHPPKVEGFWLSLSTEVSSLPTHDRYPVLPFCVHLISSSSYSTLLAVLTRALFLDLVFRLGLFCFSSRNFFNAKVKADCQMRSANDMRKAFGPVARSIDKRKAGSNG